jgi:hypothetical protein
MSEIMGQEGSGRSDVGCISSSSVTKRRRKQEIEYSCGCKYLFNRETVLEHICQEHERELITLHGGYD